MNLNPNLPCEAYQEEEGILLEKSWATSALSFASETFFSEIELPSRN